MDFIRGAVAGRRLATLALGVFGIGGLIYYKIDDALNYTQVTATVDGIEEVCHRIGGGDVWLPYSEVPDEQRNGCETRLSIRFVSPADKREHQTVVLIPIGHREEFIRKRRGTTFDIMAHDDKPDVVRLE